MKKLASAIALTVSILVPLFAEARIRELKSVELVELRKRAHAGELDAILEIGHRKDMGSEKMLLEISKRVGPGEFLYDGAPLKGSSRDETDAYWHALRRATSAKKALAKMGRKEFLQEFIGGLSGPAVEKKREAIAALAYIGDPQAIKHLAPLLFDESEPMSGSDMAFESLDRAAAGALAGILPEVMEKFKKTNPEKRGRWVNEWRDWWHENKHKYE